MVSRATLSLEPLESLVPHESIIPERARRVREEILEAGILYKPVLADRDTLTVIDGHHRLHALASIGARLVPVLLLDYDRDVETILPPTRHLPYSTAAEAADQLEAHARRGPHRVTLHGPDGTVTLYLDPVDAHLALGALEAPGPVVARPDPLEPHHVLYAARRGLLLPPRTTIHVTWGKKARAPVPLKLLA